MPLIIDSICTSFYRTAAKDYLDSVYHGIERSKVSSRAPEEGSTGCMASTAGAMEVLTL